MHPPAERASLIRRALTTLTTLCNGIAATWLLLLALVVLADVIGRGLLDQPLEGAKEILSNSVVAILFLQIPFAVLKGSMIRTTIVYDNVGASGRRAIDALACLLGLVFFTGIAVGGWDDLVIGYEVGEFEGIGALEFRTWPIRGVTVLFSAVAALVYLLLLIEAVTGTAEESA